MGRYDTDYIGGFARDGRTTPTATRLEGLQAALLIIPVDNPIHQEITQGVKLGIDFLLNAQISYGELAGAYMRAIKQIEEQGMDAESFNRRATEIRVDYVQHALSALIQHDSRKG